MTECHKHPKIGGTPHEFSREISEPLGDLIQYLVECWLPVDVATLWLKHTHLLGDQEIETLSHLKQWAWELRKLSDWPAIIE